jgi:uroporphyrinogen III methyltransferase/synthase
VDVVVAYRTADAAPAAERLRQALGEGVDLVLLASPSAVEAFVRALGDDARGVAAAVIGPVTEAAARAAGLDVKAVAPSATAEGLAAAAERCFSGAVPPRPR